MNQRHHDRKEVTGFGCLFMQVEGLSGVRGTFWHLLAPFGTDLGLGKKVPGSASSVQFMRTFEAWVLLGTFECGLVKKKRNGGMELFGVFWSKMEPILAP